MPLNTIPQTIWFFGNYTIDSKIFIENEKKTVVQSYGGSVNFGSQTLKKFFPDIQYEIFSNMYPNNTNPNASNQLTHYVLDYTSEIRKLKLQYFPPEEIGFPLESVSKPEIIFLTPVYHEVSDNLVYKLKKNYPEALLACDPQGWCRERISLTNDIILKEWIPTKKFLQSISIIKMSSEDFRKSSNDNLEDFVKNIVFHRVILIITGGLKGNICFFLKNSSNLLTCLYTPVKKASKVVDSTGAGDVWLVAFTVEFYKTGNMKKSLATAAILASSKVQVEGLNFPKISPNDLQFMINEHENMVIELELKQGLEKIFSH